jgi:hypothetical protein
MTFTKLKEEMFPKLGGRHVPVLQTHYFQIFV